MLPYRSVRKSNVLATFEVLKFAALVPNKKINYISTLGAVVAEGAMQLDPELVNRIGGYNTSIIVSELILTQARTKGFIANIFRPGTIKVHFLHRKYY